MEPAEIRAAVDGHRLWYHTMELAADVVTPGWFDLRPIVERMPWPDVRGKRCLDIGPWDGFLSFELERRGAAEVVATDIPDPRQWDLPFRTRALGGEVMARMAGERTGRGFEIARAALGSGVERVEISVYELSPERVGRFDVVVCGSLLLHLRDPVAALEAIHGVCAGSFLSAEQFEVGLTLAHRRTAIARFAAGSKGQWWLPNRVAHEQLLVAGGFRVEARRRPYAIPLGVGHPSWGQRSGGLLKTALARLVTGGSGLPHVAVLAVPDVQVNPAQAAR